LARMIKTTTTTTTRMTATNSGRPTPNMGKT
jgi:hypothetical protein